MPIKLRKNSSLEAINLTSMVDIVFFLLLFFIMSAKFEAEEREMSVVLPQASEAKPITEKPQAMFVNIDEQGRYTVAGDRLAAGQLLTKLKQAAANNPGRQEVRIRGDERCQWKFVAQVMDLCNQAKIRNYVVETAKPATRGPG